MAIDNLTFDHYSISVSNLAVSVHFYEKILGLTRKIRPDFDFAGAWFSIGNEQELHLIEDKDVNVNISGTRRLHFAFGVQDIVRFRDYLKNQNIDLVKDTKPRPDGRLQFFIADPDGYYIEITTTNSNSLSS